MRIYTRTGDKGETGLLGGERVTKSDGRIEAYGTVDELNSHLGLLRDQAPEEHRTLLEDIQNTLFALGSRLACASDADAERFKLPPVGEAHVKSLEEAMDAMDRDLAPMRNFILPGGHPCVSQAHICRTVCRRAERRVVELATLTPIPQVLVEYLNRLSDLLFVLARHIGMRLQVAEIPWKPRG
ncbi:MAG TPA: cob(I)yrinic acid a,c-diamide adenosyltransferase [Flavobacteriales bacterium]|nr:cob(I)yrinic acid a,c-diamide adenosyltransferase [Flavobacteriales bacterium]HMR26971.1 cob(I)yrinic acid a,c-diamide adenosyltransferase [Flavobacteriales bacterium]